MTSLRQGAALLLLAGFLTACGSEEGRALCEAVQSGDLETVEALIVQGTDVNENVTCQGRLTTPTRLALTSLTGRSERREAIAIAIVEAGGNPNLSWSFGESEGDPGSTNYVLANVAGGGSVATVEALVEAGARLEGEQGGEALIAAARTNQVDVLRVLADAGASVNFKSRSGDTPLIAAVEAGAREAILFLEDRGATEW